MGNKSRSGRTENHENIRNRTTTTTNQRGRSSRQMATATDKTATPDETSRDGDQDDEIRNYPSRISHKFWMRQYSWLQAEQQQQQRSQPGNDQQTVVPSLSSAAAAECAPSSPIHHQRKQQPQHHQLHYKRQTKRLLSRWGNLIRGGGGNWAANEQRVPIAAAGGGSGWWSSSSSNRVDDLIYAASATNDDDDGLHDSSSCRLTGGARSAPPQPSTSAAVEAAEATTTTTRSSQQQHVVRINVVDPPPPNDAAGTSNPSLGVKTKRMKTNETKQAPTNKKIGGYSFCGWQTNDEDEDLDDDDRPLDGHDDDEQSKLKRGEQETQRAAKWAKNEQPRQKEPPSHHHHLCSPSKTSSGRLAGWFLKSVSSSTSTLTTTIVASEQHQPANRKQDEEQEAQVRDQRHEQGAAANLNNLSPQRASPYRRLARALMISGGGGGAGCNNQDKSSEQQQRAARTSSSGGKRAKQRSQSPDKCQSSRGGGGSSLFASVFVSPRLIRRDPPAADRSKKEEKNMIKKAQEEEEQVCNFKIRNQKDDEQQEEDGDEKEEEEEQEEQARRRRRTSRVQWGADGSDGIQLQQQQQQAVLGTELGCFKTTTTTRRVETDNKSGEREQQEAVEDADLSLTDVVSIGTTTTRTTRAKNDNNSGGGDNNNEPRKEKLLATESSYRVSVADDENGDEKCEMLEGEEELKFANQELELVSSSSELNSSAKNTDAPLELELVETTTTKTEWKEKKRGNLELVVGKEKFQTTEMRDGNSRDERVDGDGNGNYANESGEQLSQAKHSKTVADDEEPQQVTTTSVDVVSSTTTTDAVGKQTNQSVRGESAQISRNETSTASGVPGLSRTTANNTETGTDFNQLEQHLMPLIRPFAGGAGSSAGGSPTFEEDDDADVDDYFEHNRDDGAQQHASVGSVSFVLLNNDDDDEEDPDELERFQGDEERPASQPVSMLTTTTSSQQQQPFQQPQPPPLPPPPTSQTIVKDHQKEAPASYRSSNKQSLTASSSGGCVGTSTSASAAGAHGGGGGGFVGLKSNFKKLVKRQQSVDSYRMARDLKNKLKRQQEGRTKHQSNEAIKTTKSTELDSTTAGGRKYSMRQLNTVAVGASNEQSASMSSTSHGVVKWRQKQRQESHEDAVVEPVLKICVDPYAEPGSFGLPSSSVSPATTTTTAAAAAANKAAEKRGGQRGATSKQVKVAPTPPNTLSLMPNSGTGGSGTGGSNLLLGSGFSGCITPTYPTHHLPSPKYVSPAMFSAMEKKYSNASTISSSFGGDSLATQATSNLNNSGGPKTNGRCSEQAGPATATTTSATNATTNQSDTESSMGAGSVTPSRLSCGATGSNRPSVQLSSGHGGISDRAATPVSQAGADQLAASIARANEEAAAALRRANLAEHIYDNKCGLGEDMKFLASLPELCDITFLVGETREPVCAVKSVLAARSRVFHKILFGSRTATGRSSRLTRQQHQHSTMNDGLVATSGGGGEAPIIVMPTENNTSGQQEQPDKTARQDSIDAGGRSSDLRRGSSPRQAVQVARNWVNAVKSSSPVSHRSTSPNQQQQQQQQHQQWSVMSDASGYKNPSSTRVDSATATSMATTSGQTTTGGGGGSRSGRVSVASNGRDSGVSQTSQGSQQPLIIGPGQTATPAKRSKKGASSRSGAMGSVDQHHHHGGASRLRSMFSNKRASDPSIKQNSHHHQTSSTIGNQNYLDKMSSSQMSTTMIIEEFEPDVFRQLIEYIHTGCVLLQARTLLGLLNAADYYGLEQLRKACLRFVSCCITVDTVCSLLSTAERYIQYKCTKSIVQKVLEFVDSHANEIFKLNAFGLLPEHVVRLILARDGLQADEFVKYNGVYTWCEHYCRSYELTNIADVMRNFLDLIQLYKIPTNLLLSEIYPTHVIPDNLFLSALAYQADPENFEPQPARPRRMTLPNPTNIYNRHFDDDDDEDDGPDYAAAVTYAAAAATTNESPTTMADIAQVDESGEDFNAVSARSSISSSKVRSIRRRDSSTVNANEQHHQQFATTTGTRRDSTTSGPRGGQLTARRSQVSIGGQSTSVAPPSKQQPAASKSRKGSIAQASINGVMRLSHKLSIRKRHSSNVSAEENRRRGSTATGSASIGSGGRQKSHHKKATSISKQSSIATCGSQAASDHHHHRADPLQVGQQILNAYLVEQRQRELEEKERLRREAEERRAAAEEARHHRGSGAGRSSQDAPNSSPLISINSSSTEQQSPSKQSVGKSVSSSRKSFRDFKHISRRLFMRHSSSKTLQQQQSTSSRTSESQPAGSEPLASTMSSMSQGERRRNMLKIKRSETVFETSSQHASPTSSSNKHQQAKLSHQLSSNAK